MKEYILKRCKWGRKIGIAGFFFLIGFLALVTISVLTDIRALVGAGLGCMAASVPLLVIFFELYQPMISSYKYLKKHDLVEQIGDINPNMFILPLSKISFGSKAFFSKKSKVVVPYQMVLWVYIQVVYTNGIKSDEKVYIGCRDRKWFMIRAEKQELPRLLNIIANHSPGLILGYGDEQNKRYYEITEKFLRERKK